MSDLISRQAAIDAFWELDIETRLSWAYAVTTMLRQLPSAQPAKDTNVPSKDTISRQAAIDICENAIDLWRDQLGCGVIIAIKNRIVKLPSAQPEPIKIQADHELTHDELVKLRKDLADAPIVLMPSTQEHKIHFADADHVWIDGKQYISLRRFQKAVVEARTEHKTGRWIPVTERLPEEKRDGFSEDVLMLVENPDGDITWKDVYVGYYLYDATSEETGWWAMMTCDCVKIGEHKHGYEVFPANEYVTHWMPLPEPPKEE